MWRSIHCTTVRLRSTSLSRKRAKRESSCSGTTEWAFRNWSVSWFRLNWKLFQTGNIRCPMKVADTHPIDCRLRLRSQVLHHPVIQSAARIRNQNVDLASQNHVSRSEEHTSE